MKILAAIFWIGVILGSCAGCATNEYDPYASDDSFGRVGGKTDAILKCRHGSILMCDAHGRGRNAQVSNCSCATVGGNF